MLNHSQLLKSFAKQQTPLKGKQLHAHIIRSGLEQCWPLPNNLIHMYGRCGLLGDAHQVFDNMRQRDAVSWASILSALARANQSRQALEMFSSMNLCDQIEPDDYIFATAISACATLPEGAKPGQQLHARFLSSHFVGDEIVNSALIDMYSKCSLVDDARKVFDSMPHKNCICWTALVSGYAKSGRVLEAVKVFKRMPTRDLFAWTALISGLVQSGDSASGLKFFVEMRSQAVRINDPFVVSTAIGASSDLAALHLGRQLHCLVVALGYESSTVVANALVDMYAKCSAIVAAKKVFNDILQKDIVSWTTMIVGAAQHGRAEDSLALFDEMVSARFRPNEVTFVGLVHACSHAGLVGKGLQLFNSMIVNYAIAPSLQHYTCLLDLYGRSGLLVEAEQLIQVMPFKPDEACWAALLSACNHHNNTHLGIKVANQLSSLNLQDPSIYISLSNLYAGAGMWNDVSRVRKLMADMGHGRKEPGYSWIDLGNESHIFYAGQSDLPMKYEILKLLTGLDLEMKKRDYNLHTSFLCCELKCESTE